MKSLELNQMEDLQGGDMETCAVAGLMGAVHLSFLGPWGFIAGGIIGCLGSQL